MKKKNILWAILCLIFLIIFNASFFVAGGTTQPVSVWISYGFIHFAYLMLLMTPFLIRKGKSSAVFGFSIYTISATYFLVAFITGIIFILISPESFNAALLVQLCIAGIYGIILVSVLIANEHTAESEEKRQPQIAYIKVASSKVKVLLERLSDKETKRIVERVYDAIYSSPVKSHLEMEQMDNRILQSIKDLELSVESENKEEIISVAKSLLFLINERNNFLKTLH